VQHFLIPVTDDYKRKMAQNVVLKILILGSDSVDNFKVIADRYFSTDYKTIVGVNVLSKTIPVQHEGNRMNAVLSMWDISSKTRFEDIRKIFFKGGVGALFLFDLSNPSTWYHIIECYKEIEIAFKKIPFMVISNLPGKKKIMVNEKDVEEWVEQKGGHYTLIDMKNLTRLESTFKNLVAEIVTINSSS
jgi:signal recognition particle receptor subunit beta